MDRIKTAFLILIAIAVTTCQAHATATLTVQGSAGSYYSGIDFGQGDKWTHNRGSAGDLTIVDASGATFNNITYPSYSASGDTTTFTAATLASGYTITTKYQLVSTGIYLVTVTHQSSTERWIKIIKNLGGVNTSNSSTVLDYKNSVAKNTDMLLNNPTPLQAVALHHTSGSAVALIAGNGYDNDWTLYSPNFDDTHTSYFNTGICSKTSTTITLTYGALKNGATNDYSVHLVAGVPRDTTFVITIGTPTSQSTLNSWLYSSLHDAYYPAGAGRNAVEKTVWATSFQLVQQLRHNPSDGRKWLWFEAANLYTPLMDGINQVITLNIPSLILAALDTVHNLGPADDAAIASNTWGAATNVMDGSYPLHIPLLEYYATLHAGYAPDSSTRATYLAIADSYADAINNVKMLPDTSTRLAHLTANMLAAQEGIGYGDFEQPFTFTESSDTIYRWTVASGSVSRVGTDSGHAPNGGSYQAKFVNSGQLTLVPLGVPGGKNITMTAYLNIPSAWSGSGARLRVIEYNSARSQVATTAQASYTNVTSGWQQLSFNLTLQATTVYVLLALETSGTGTAYFDDVQSVITDPPYAGLMWDMNIMPPQILANALSPTSFTMQNVQLNLRCLKRLLGGAWTVSHQQALDAVDATYPAAFWTDGSHIKIKDSIYHWTRSNWLNAWVLWGHFQWYIVSGEKIFSNTDVANIYANYPRGALGTSALKGWVCHVDGSYINESVWITGWPSTAGFYVNGSSWFDNDVSFHKSAEWAGVSGAAANYTARLSLEVAVDWNSHENLEASGTGQKGNGTIGLSMLTPAPEVTANISNFGSLQKISNMGNLSKITGLQ